MINENRQLIANINAQRAELEELNQILGQADAKLRMDDKKQKYKILKEQVTTLEKKKEELEIQTNEVSSAIDGKLIMRIEQFEFPRGQRQTARESEG